MVTALSPIKVEATPVFYANEKAYRDKYPIICNEGGARSGKTFSVIQLLIYIALTVKRIRISIVSHSLPHIKRGAFRDFRMIMESMKLWSDNNFSYSDFIYTFPNGSYIELFGLEDETKARGPARDILFVNESNLISKQVFDQLAMRTSGQIFLDWNPADFNCWCYIVADDPRNKRIHSTYLNNRANLSQMQIDLIEAHRNSPDDFMWKVYGLGLRGASKELIYTHWKYCTELPLKGEVFYGQDFGFNVASALTRIEYYEGSIYAKQLIYEIKLTTGDLIERYKLLGIGKTSEIYCDSAEPKTIEELCRAGYNAMPADKDVTEGIRKVKSMPLFITNDSKEAAAELQGYKWKVDKDGNLLDEPVKLRDHFCFVGETMISTDKGQLAIKDIKCGDKVLTSKGFKNVLNVYNNGLKQVVKYRMQLGMESVYLTCTPDHLIKTDSSWQKVSQLKSGAIIYLNRDLKAKHISSTQEKDISAKVKTGCILLFGNIITGLRQKVSTFIIKTKIPGIMQLIILSLWKRTSICLSTVSKKLKTILNGLKDFGKQVLRLHPNGTDQKMAWSGIGSMQKTIISGYLILAKENASCVQQNLLPKQKVQNSAQTIASLNTEGIVEPIMSIETACGAELNMSLTNIQRQYTVLKIVAENIILKKNVYDLEIEDAHEYFANGVLVHNCDSLRYGTFSKLSRPNFDFDAFLALNK